MAHVFSKAKSGLLQSQALSQTLPFCDTVTADTGPHHKPHSPSSSQQRQRASQTGLQLSTLAPQATCIKQPIMKEKPPNCHSPRGSGRLHYWAAEDRHGAGNTKGPSSAGAPRERPSWVPSRKTATPGTSHNRNPRKDLENPPTTTRSKRHN